MNAPREKEIARSERPRCGRPDSVFHEVQSLLRGTGWRATRLLDGDAGLYGALIEKTAG